MVNTTVNHLVLITGGTVVENFELQTKRLNGNQILDNTALILPQPNITKD